MTTIKEKEAWNGPFMKSNYNTVWGNILDWSRVTLNLVCY